MATQQHIFTGAVAPASTPPGVGHHYLNTATGDLYISNGTTSSANWKLLATGSGLTYPLVLPLGSLGAPTLQFDSDTGIWSSGDGNISFSANGQLRFEVLQNSVEVTGPLNVSGNFSAANFPPTGTVNKIAQFDSLGDLNFNNNITIDPNNTGISISNLIEPNNSGGSTLNGTNISIEPLQNSPAEVWLYSNVQVDIDPSSSGFTFGTGGNAFYFDTRNINHGGTSNTGSLNFISNTFNLGNGTDPISVNGFSYAFGQGQVNAGVTVNGTVQGYGFQPSFNAASFLTSNVNVFYDFANMPIAVQSYTTFSASPTIGSITNNNNLLSFQSNPTVTTFTGNAGFGGIGLFGNFTTFNTGGYQGITISPNITTMVSGSYFGINSAPAIGSVTNATGINIDMSNVTGTNVLAANFNGDVSINGDLSFSGALAIGALNAYAAQAVVNGGGSPSTIHGLISSPTVANGLTIANIDTIGVNTAMLVDIGTGCTLTSGAFGLGLAALALPAVVNIGAGSTCDIMAGGVFALSMGGGSGTIDLTKGCRAVFIGDGTTTVNKFYAMSCETLGLGATENWGVHADSVEYNFMQSLKIGGTTGSTDKVTGVSNGLEFAPTKAFVATNVTTTERNALTAVNGMIVYNTTTSKFQGYEAGAWVDLI